MPIFDLYSKRRKRLLGDVPDVYSYDCIPNDLRIQIVHIIQDAVGKSSSRNQEEIYTLINNTLCREYGKFNLIEDRYTYYEDKVLNFMLQTNINDQVIDVIELSFKCIENIIKRNFEIYVQNTTVKIKPDAAIEELNQRFKEHGIGYQFEGNKIIRVDSTFIHSEITKPTISLLWNSKFAGANEEYMNAHEHYRHGRNKECLTECLKAFESTLKIICNEKGWVYNQTDTSKKLIQLCFDKGLVPTFTQNQFTSLQNLIESGIPTLRNKLGGHGQGQIPIVLDDDITRYGLNLTGANIIFLIERSGI
jgi:AbiJ N-terminal domain 4